ncbi:MAG: hypothetical protein ACR2P6_06915 [Gammaproteobacteria bacterium]
MRNRWPELIACSMLLAGNALADDHTWQRVTGTAALTEFMTDVRLEAEFGDGVKSVSRYRADGTGYLESWNGRFNRTWMIKDNNQVCVASQTKSECFWIEQDTAQPEAYRVVDDENRATRINRVPDGGDEVVVSVDSAVAVQNQRGLPSIDELANEFINPNTSLTFLSSDTDYIRYQGDIPDADTQSRLMTTVRPTAPFPVGDPQTQTNFAFRPIVPIVWRADVPAETGGFDSEGVDLGDITLAPSVRRTFDNGVIFGGGFALTMPTATDDALGLDQWLLGPSIALGAQRRWGVLAATVSTQWDFAGEDDYDTQLSIARLLYAASLPKGWQIFGAPTITYDHEANSNNDLALPISIGIAHTRLLNRKPWRFALEYWHYIESPDAFGPDYQIRFTVSPSITTPWLKRVCDGRLPWC